MVNCVTILLEAFECGKVVASTKECQEHSMFAGGRKGHNRMVVKMNENKYGKIWLCCAVDRH